MTGNKTRLLKILALWPLSLSDHAMGAAKTEACIRLGFETEVSCLLRK